MNDDTPTPEAEAKPRTLADALADVLDEMIAEAVPLVIARTRVDDARHVLWFFGDRELGREPGSFVGKIMEAAAAADTLNLAMLGQVYTWLEAWAVARDIEDGMDRLRTRVREHEAAMAAAFDMPTPEAQP